MGLEIRRCFLYRPTKRSTLIANDIKDAAGDKILSKILQLSRELRGIIKDVEADTTCGLSEEQMQVLYTATKRQLDIYNYIFALIELSK